MPVKLGLHYAEIVNDLPPDEVQKNKITTQSASAAMSALKFVTNNSSFANKSTLPEPILLYKLNNNSLGLITSEAKAVTDSCSVTFAQAIQVASDCALQTFNYMQANDKSVTYEDVVVPFVVAASDTVQFGVVYLIQDNFPNSCLLSEEISLLNPDGRVEISRWLFALSKLVHHYLGLFPSLLSKKNKLSNIDCRLNLDGMILKPLETFTENTTEPTLLFSRATSILNIYKKLWDNQKSKELVCFPEGTIGFPDVNQDEFLKSVKAKLQEFGQLSTTKQVDNFEPGHIVFIYRSLIF